MPIPLISNFSLSTAPLQTSMNNPSFETSLDQSLSSTSSADLQSYMYDKKVSFRLKEKLVPLKGNYRITLADSDKDVFKVQSKMLSVSSQKVISDMSNNVIYKLSAAKASIRDRMTIVDKCDKPVLKLRKKGVMPGFGRSTLLAFPGDDEGEDPVFEIVGNWCKKDFMIRSAGECVAVVRRKILDVGSLLVGKDCYSVDVEPGVDCALLLLLVVALDEVFRDGAGVITGGGLRGLL